MDSQPSGLVTQLLQEWGAGKKEALDSLMPLVYDELRSMAARHLRQERASHTLQRTALVHEVFVRLVDQTRVSWLNRSQFLAVASQLMRRILVDHARKHLSQKRGGDLKRVPIDSTAASGHVDLDARQAFGAMTVESACDLTAVDRALTRLERLDPRQGQLVELRFFGGLSIEESAGVLEISPATVKREWALARAWLQRELNADSPNDS
jgi:RNA polymerase sigma factor (TIGR02999 family)